MVAGTVGDGVAAGAEEGAIGDEEGAIGDEEGAIGDEEGAIGDGDGNGDGVSSGQFPLTVLIIIAIITIALYSKWPVIIMM